MTLEINDACFVINLISALHLDIVTMDYDNTLYVQRALRQFAAGTRNKRRRIGIVVPRM